jgi:ring-1,2-phenylacetyl-CoA epoxidase subunit PaaC
MKAAIDKTLPDFQGVFSLGENGSEIVEQGLIESEAALLNKWNQAVAPVLESVGLQGAVEVGMAQGDGRNGKHTEDLVKALETLCEVYESDKAASW